MTMIAPVLPPQKIMKVGNSFAVTIPRPFMKKHQLKAGSAVFPKMSDGDIQFSIKIPRATAYEEVDDQEFVTLSKDVELRYGNVLKKLANLP